MTPQAKPATVLNELEWSATYSYCTGWPCCPICKGIKPGHGADEAGNLPTNQGHRETCRLAAAIALHNEKNHGELYFGGCEQHRDRVDLSCARIRRVKDGLPLTTAEVWDALSENT